MSSCSSRRAQACWPASTASSFVAEDYLVIPKGTTYQMKLKSPKAFFLIMESLYRSISPPTILTRPAKRT